MTKKQRVSHDPEFLYQKWVNQVHNHGNSFDEKEQEESEFHQELMEECNVI